ncbi:MAG: hypothetical protein H0V82_11695 [Candidatus Protochlamydia sp.]|nr:hypothetical protein [Candidatus Protochlamydia sp.]
MDSSRRILNAAKLWRASSPRFTIGGLHFVRWVEPDRHAKAVTSRPLMLYGVAKEVQHTWHITIRVTSMHGTAVEVCKKVGSPALA